MLSYFYIYFFTEKKTKYVITIPVWANQNKYIKEHFSQREREREKEKSPELSHPSFRHLPEMTDLETCWIPEIWSTFWEASFRFCGLRSQPAQWTPLTKDSQNKALQLTWMDLSSLHRQNNAVPDHDGDCKDLLLVLSPSTQLLQLFSYHLYDRSPTISVLPAVTILEKSSSMINADRKYRECLICLF